MAEFRVTDVAEPVIAAGGPETLEKVAVTLRFEFIVTWQVVAVPEQAPDQPLKTELASGLAVKVTPVPAGKVVPEGLLVTLPLPVPALFIVRV